MTKFELTEQEKKFVNAFVERDAVKRALQDLAKIAVKKRLADAVSAHSEQPTRENAGRLLRAYSDYWVYTVDPLLEDISEAGVTDEEFDAELNKLLDEYRASRSQRDASEE
ncbi:MAG: hypothetical protein HYU59_05600 [Magnetospirillum gryphiswaldense]|nr:hypothetical protein [Magnetospirillum gryphiswaldense]